MFARLSWSAFLSYLESARRFFRIPSHRLLIGLAVISGVAAGISAFLFERLLSFVHDVSYGQFPIAGPIWSRAWILLLPALGGLLAALVTRYISKEAKGQGVAEVIYAIRRGESRIMARTVIAKAVASAFTIGTGGSAGPEGPVIQIGGGVGSNVGRLLRLPPDLLRTMVAAGAAGGLSAVFNAPIAGVLFAMEVLLRDFVVNAFSLVVLSSVSAAVTAHLLLGDKTFLQTPPFVIRSTVELLLYGGLGTLIALLSTVFVGTMNKIETIFEKSHLPEIWKPMMGGFAVGVVGWVLPPILGPGIEFMGSVVRGQVAVGGWTILLFALLFAAKVFGTALTLGSGGSGGLLMPSFFCGGMAGAVFGLAVKFVIPGVAGYGSYALVGMVAFFSAVTRAPLTAIILLFELTHDQRVILPTMVCCVIAAYFAQRLSPLSYELLRLGKRGLSAEEIEQKDFLSGIRVESVMVRTVVSLKESMSLGDLKNVIAKRRLTGFPVLNDQGLLTGLLTDNELYRAVTEEKDPTQLTVGAMMRRPVRTVTPNVSLRKAIEIMNESGQDRIPVVDNMNPQHMVGLVSRSQILDAYKRKTIG